MSDKMVRGTYMRRHYGLLVLQDLARQISMLLGKRVSVDEALDDLDRFINRYGLSVDEAKRSVLVLHGVPPGLTGPLDRRYTWQQEIDAYIGT